jgi:hypothetical protein
VETIEIMSQKLEHLSLKALDEIRADIGFFISRKCGSMIL